MEELEVTMRYQYIFIMKEVILPNFLVAGEGGGADRDSSLKFNFPTTMCESARPENHDHATLYCMCCKCNGDWELLS